MPSNVTPLQVSRYICAADELGRQSGLHFTMGDDFGEYVSISSKLPGKSRTYPSFQSNYSDLGDGKAFWIMGHDGEGKVAHVQAMRLDDLADTFLAEHLESLRAWLADPSTQIGSDSSCTCKAPAARHMTGRIAYRGDLWLREDFRGRGLMTFLGRIAFGLAWAKWSPDFLYALVANWYIEKGIADRCGYLHREPHGAVLRMPALGINDDDWLVWLTRDELLQMLSTCEIADAWARHSAHRRRSRDA
ncbi:hypothetical protein ACXHXM_33905